MREAFIALAFPPARLPAMTRRLAAALLAALLAAPPALAYVVQRGDTLYGLARRENVTVDDLRRLNGLTSDTLAVGQVLKLPSEAAPAREIGGVKVVVPSLLREGEAFTVRLSGERAAEARVRFLSETSEDVRSPAEELAPFGAAGEYAVLGRVVLGQTRPLRYEVRIGDDVLAGSVPVRTRGLRVQNLNLAPEIASKRQDPRRVDEEALVEKAYARRTAQAWTQPFAGPGGVQIVSTQFGQPRRYTKDEELKYHYGIDYAQPSGTPIRAMNAGTVVIAGTYPVRGGLVVVDHGLGVLSMYFHQRRVSVKVGDRVTRGQKLGEVGSTGLSTGPHLHLEVRVRGEAVNPLDLVGKLLP